MRNDFRYTVADVNVTLDDVIIIFFNSDCDKYLRKLLTYIFNLILRIAIFPDRWNTARVSPIFKMDDPSLIENCRAVSIPCNFAKMFEIILYNIVYN